MGIRLGRSALAALTLAFMGTIATAADERSDNASPIYNVQLPPGYRDWKVISVAHEAGSLNSIRVILGNKKAEEALRTERRPLPDGAVLARVAWKYVSSPVNNAIFGQEQSFVAGNPINVQISIKNSKRYAATSGWGYGQFDAGRANPEVKLIQTCYACHNRLPSSEDRVFTSYAP